jgi:hypothetical protein
MSSPREEGGPMADVINIVMTVVFFGLSMALIAGMERV